MRAQFLVSSTFQGIRRNVSMVLSVILVVAVSLLLVGGAVLASKQVNTLKDEWYDKVEVTVYLCTKYPSPTCPHAATDADQQQVETTLTALPQVQRVYYESQQQAYTEFKRDFADQPDLVNNADPDAIPASYRVKLKDPTQYAVVARALQGAPGVDQVYDAHQALKKIFSIFDFIVISFLIVAGVIALAAVILIVNTTRLAFFGRRREVGIMRLVGASTTYIELPFLAEAAIAGVVGSLIAFGLLFVGRSFMVTALQQIGIFQHFIGTHAVWSLLPWGVLAGAGVAMLAAWATLLRYLRA
jgi:cell division transport system permease protein